MVGVQGENDNTYKHFDVHNLYGYMESIPSFEASRQITGTRGFVITRSTFIGNGKYGGHWTGVLYFFFIISLFLIYLLIIFFRIIIRYLIFFLIKKKRFMMKYFKYVKSSGHI